MRPLASRWLVCDPDRAWWPAVIRAGRHPPRCLVKVRHRTGRDVTPCWPSSWRRSSPKLRCNGWANLSKHWGYGDQAEAAWVGEGVEFPRPGLPRSQSPARLRAALARALPVQVFRLPAIYGPGRTPFSKAA